MAETIPRFSRYGQGDAHFSPRQFLIDMGFDPDVLSPTGSGLWLTRSGESQGVTAAHLSNPHYVIVGEAQDAVIGLFSQREGDHTSGLDLAEMFPAGTLVDKWFVGKSASNATFGPGSSIIMEYGTNADYGTNTRLFEFTKAGSLIVGGGSNGAFYNTKPNLIITNNGTISVGANAFTTRGITVASSVTGGTSVTGIYSQPVGQSDGTSELRAYVAEPNTQATSYTCAATMGMRVNNAVKGAGSTITIQYGIFIDNQTQGGTNYALYTNTGLVRFGDLVTTIASASASAGFRVPHGAAPSSPVDGDLWTTTAGLFVRINGVTKTVTLT
jgi:hypothetical protein